MRRAENLEAPPCLGKDGDSIIVLLVGGDKGSQAKDISRAQSFWRDYLEAKGHGKAK